MFSDELTLFRILQAWAAEENEQCDNNNENNQAEEEKGSSLTSPSKSLPGGFSSSSRTGSRMDQARTLKRHIKLALIPPIEIEFQRIEI